MIYTRRSNTVNAVQHFGASTPISSHLKGDQVAKSGDFLVVDPLAVAAIRAQEKAEGIAPNSLGNKGTVYVISKDQFLADYDATDATPGLAPSTGFDVPDQLDVNAAAVVAEPATK
jgi:hypothetical protein